MPTIGPVKPVQPLTSQASAPVWAPPWRSSTTMLSTPWACSSAAYRLAVSTSSAKSRPATPCWLTISAVPSSVMPMKPTSTACTRWTA